MLVFRSLLLSLLLVSWMATTPMFAAAPADDNELPDLEAKDEWDEEEDSPEAANAPLTHYYYDYRSSERFCLTPKQARARNLLPQGSLRPCVQKK